MTTLTFVPAFQSRIMPVIALEHEDQAVPLAHALLAGGIDVMEITLRHPCALAAITRVVREVPSMHVGAGTLTRPDDVARVQDAGAQFALSPGMTDALAQAALRAGLAFIPGVMTPSEAMIANDYGFSLMKLFPAQQAGAIGMLKAMAGPLAHLKFCPTGGVSPENMVDFLRLSNVAMVGGSWLTPAELLRAGRWQEVTALARHAVERVASVA